MSHQSVQIPPDSTGKQIFHRVEVIVNYNNGTIDFTEGSTVVGGTSGLTGTILHVNGTTSSGNIHVITESESPVQVIDGEDLLQDGTKYAEADGTISTANTFYIPVTQIQGANDTDNSAFVDQYGGLYIRGKEGDFLFDGFGNLRSQGSIVLSQHVYKYGLDTRHISYTTDGSATVEINEVIPAAVFTTPTASGDSVKMRTDKYFNYDQSHPIQLALPMYLGDSGKSNVVRKWGYFDDTQGAWFELDGTTLNIVVKIAQLGGFEYRIPQSQWNGDRVNGQGGANNLSEYNVDLTKTNIWGLEWQNSVGFIFFKLVTTSGIVTCHVFPMLNVFTGTNTGGFTMNLPVSVEQYNTGVSSGTSQMYLMGYGLLQSTSDFNIRRRGASAELDNLPVSGGSNYQALATLRMNKKFVRPNGTLSSKENRSHAYPQDIQIYVSGGPISLAAVIDPTLNGSETWGASASNLEVDLTGKYTDLGNVVQYNIINDGEIWRYNHLSEGGGIRENSPALNRKADINAAPMLVGFAAKSLKGVPVNVSVTISWYEVGF